MGCGWVLRGATGSGGRLPRLLLVSDREVDPSNLLGFLEMKERRVGDDDGDVGLSN